MVIGITEVKPKKHTFLINTPQLGLSDCDLCYYIDSKEEEFVHILTKHLKQHSSNPWSSTFKNRYGL